MSNPSLHHLGAPHSYVIDQASLEWACRKRERDGVGRVASGGGPKNFFFQAENRDVKYT